MSSARTLRAEECTGDQTTTTIRATVTRAADLFAAPGEPEQADD